MAVGVVVLVVVAGCLVGGTLAVRSYLAQPARAEVGDCLADDAGAKVPYSQAGCDDKAARYKVLAVSKADGNPCVGVPGASRLYRIDGKVFCVGRKDADPAKSANIAKDGDCLRIGRGIESERLDCADPKANVKVLRRLTDISVGGLPNLNSGPCADVAGTVLVYTYDWQSDPPGQPIVPSLGRNVDLGFCLARVNEPPPAVPDAVRDCRYVTREAVLAAANATNGNRYTAVRASMAGPLGCDYRLTQGGQSYLDGIVIKLGADTAWPPAGMQEFDLDGAKAAWRDSHAGGGGSLFVDRPTGRFEIAFVVGGDFTGARETAIAIYRAAAKHIP
jgi:hypothetical protein